MIEERPPAMDEDMARDREASDEAAEEAEGEAAGKHDVDLAALRARLGIDEEGPIPYETCDLRLGELDVSSGALARGAGAFEVSYELVGLMHPPAVERYTMQDMQGQAVTRYRIIAGRRRVLAAVGKGWLSMECHVYQGLNDAQRALLAASENGRRAPNWITETQSLLELTESRTALTEREVAAVLGWTVSQVRERMRLVKLPAPILEECFAGRLDQGTAKRITRLSPSQQQRLVDAVLRGEAITKEMVDRALRGQFDVMAAPLAPYLAPPLAPATAAAPVAPAPVGQTSPEGRPTSSAPSRRAEKGKASMAGAMAGGSVPDMVAQVRAIESRLATFQPIPARLLALLDQVEIELARLAEPRSA